MEEEIILVDENDKEVGIGEKLEVHRQGKLHRAFSILIFNSKGEILIQKRPRSKYHSAGLWSNTCCSHPRSNETLKEAVNRRLKEEMGIEGVECQLKEIFSFVYRVDLGNLTEYELDHVFIGEFDGTPKPDKREVEDWKWISPRELRKDIKENSEKYTYWFKIILDKAEQSRKVI